MATRKRRPTSNSRSNTNQNNRSQLRTKTGEAGWLVKLFGDRNGNAPSSIAGLTILILVVEIGRAHV